MQIEGSQTKGMKETLSPPYLDLLWYSITKFTAYGYFDLTASLWKSALESEPKHLKDNLNLIVEKIFTKQYLNPLTSLEQIQKICQINCWNENSQYYQALSNTFDRYLTRRLHEKNPPNVANEYSRLQEFSIEKQTNTPHSPRNETDSHLQKSRYLLGLCALSRIQPIVNQQEIHQFYEQATQEFNLALKLSKSTELLVTDTLLRSADTTTGDVVTDTLQRKPKDNLGKTLIEFKFLEILKSEHLSLSNFLTSPTEAASYHRKLTAPHLTSTHVMLLHQNLPHSGSEGGNYRMNFEIETHRSVMTHLMNEIPRHVNSVEPILHQLQAYLTRFYSHLLPEKTSRPSPSLVPLPYSDDEIHTPPVYSHILLRHLYSLARAHSQRLVTSTTRPINPLKTSDQFYLRNLFSQAMFNARYLRLQIPHGVTDTETTDDDDVLSTDSTEEESAVEEELSEDETTGTTTSTSPGSHCLHENFHHQISPHLSDPSLLLSSRDYGNYFLTLESYGEHLIDLSERSGIQLDGYFYANWIHSVPLCRLDSRIPTPWRYSYTEYLKNRILKRGVTEMRRRRSGSDSRGSRNDHRHGGVDVGVLVPRDRTEQQIDVIHHAVICHLCSYRDPEAIEYAYHTAREMYPATPLPVDIWNTLLTTAAYNCPGKFVAPLLLEAQQECSAEFLQVPFSELEENYFDFLRRRAELMELSSSSSDEEMEGDGKIRGNFFGVDEEFSNETLSALIQMKFVSPEATGAGEGEAAAEGGAGGVTSSVLQFDSNLAKAMLLGHFLTKNKYQSLRMMKALQFHGYRSPTKLYRKLIKCLLFPKEPSPEGDPLESYLSCHPEVTAPVIHEMMCRDGIRFDGTILSALGELFLYPVQHHQHQQGNLLNTLTAAREFLIESCLLHNVTPNEQILRVLKDISLAGTGTWASGGGGAGGRGILTSQLLTFINEFNEQAVAAGKPPLIPTVAMLKLFPSSSESSSDWRDENGTPGSVILERWIELWAENEPEKNFEEVIGVVSQQHGLLPSPRSLKKLLAKEIQGKNSVAANRVGSVYLSVFNELEKRKGREMDSNTSSLTGGGGGGSRSLEEKLRSAHEELQQLFEGYEIPFTISMKRISKE